MASLVEIKGKVDGTRHDLSTLEDQQIIQIGREKCRIICESRAVSRQHCELYKKGEGIVVHDLGSTVGTYVNAVRLIGERTLHDGDILVLADATFRFEDDHPVDNNTYMVNAGIKVEKVVEDAGGRVERGAFAAQAEFAKLQAQTRELQAEVAVARASRQRLAILLLVTLVIAVLALAVGLKAWIHAG
jgi:pSer/pThr/pTyr-binding forkhead associated (FHA) protein